LLQDRNLFNRAPEGIKARKSYAGSMQANLGDKLFSENVAGPETSE
jgi:hypothetical protein